MILHVTLVTVLLGCVNTLSNGSRNNTLTFSEIKDFINQLDLLPILFNATDGIFTNSTLRCLNAYTGISKLDFIQYLDAIGKPPSGLLLGDLYWLGNYRECMKIPNAHYCNIDEIKITAFQQFVLFGMCVPEICQVDDVIALLQYASKALAALNIHVFTVEKNYALSTQFNADSACYSKEITFSTGAIVMIIITSLIGFLCLLGTIADRVLYYSKERQAKTYFVYVEDDDSRIEDTKPTDADGTIVSMRQVNLDKDQNMAVRFLLCFSLIKNTRSLFDTNSPRGAITSINGIRTLSIMWVILGHTLVFSLGATKNVLDVFQWLPRFTMQAVVNATVSVDSFFFLSGLLVSYLSLKRFQKTGSLPLLRYYLHRYIRLTPSYVYLIFFWTFLYPFLSNGPLWYMQGPHSGQAENCIKYWWTNLLYINNLYPDLSSSCLNWSWYLANDMQFYVISPIVLFAMYKFKWIGVVAANGVLLMACLICNGVLMHTENASPLFYDPENSKMGIASPDSPILRYMKYIYEMPYTRISSYLVGLVLGYILTQKNPINVKARQQYIFYSFGWLVAVGVGVAVVYGPYSTSDYKWGEVSTIIYGVFFRMAWAMAVGWVVYACHNGYGGLVNDMMSWKAFIPLSRLTYSTYLVHPMVIYIFYFSTNAGVTMTTMNYAFFFVGVTTISFTLAYIVAVSIEYPILNLEKLLLKF